jgi:hypothetical protein
MLIPLFIYELLLIYLFSYILLLPTIKIRNELEEMVSAGQNGYRRQGGSRRCASWPGLLNNYLNSI